MSEGRLYPARALRPRRRTRGYSPSSMPRAALALLVLLALGGAAAWLVGAERGPRARGVYAGRAAVEAETAAELAPARGTNSTATGVPPEASREALRVTPEDELVGAQWVEGRVVFPAGTPADEEAYVL